MNFRLRPPHFRVRSSGNNPACSFHRQPVVRRRKERLAGSRAAVGVPERGAGADPHRWQDGDGVYCEFAIWILDHRVTDQTEHIVW